MIVLELIEESGMRHKIYTHSHHTAFSVYSQYLDAQRVKEATITPIGEDEIKGLMDSLKIHLELIQHRKEKTHE